MSETQNILRQALSRQQAGDLRTAEQLCRQVIQVEPNNGPAWHLLGLVALNAGRPQTAVDLVSRAIRLNGSLAGFHSTLAEALRALGRVDEAIASYRQTLRLEPEEPQAHNNLATLLHAQGNTTAAVVEFREAIRLAPDYPDPHFNLGLIWQQARELGEAEREFTAVLAMRPDHHLAAMALASLWQSQGRVDEAQRLFGQISQALPGAPQVQMALGVGYQAQGNHAAAEAAYRRALELAPNLAEAHYDLGTLLTVMGRELEAIEAFNRALQCNPNMGEVYSNLSNTFLRITCPDEAADAALRAIELSPQSGMAVANLANARQMQADLPGAIAGFRRALELRPDDASNHSNLLYLLNFQPGLDPAVLFAEHRTWAALHADPLTAAAVPHPNERSPERRLRIGYVSGHFRHHAVAFFSESLLAAHDREQFEVFCYANQDRDDATTDRFRARADGWRDIFRLSDRDSAALIRDDRIDILVDLAGHIGGNRLLTFAHRPAPVQVTYLGYQNTTGMRAMDYRLTDAHADPLGTNDSWYCERLVRLSGAFFCYGPPEEAPPVNAPPFESRGHITFASLNNMNKLHDEAFRAWARILDQVPGSRLLVLGYVPGVFERRVRQLFYDEGIDPARVDVVPKRPRADYLALHHQIDIALDSFPFNGHTTVCDALWMGVPSVMLEGASYATRFGGRTLLDTGLGDLIAGNVADYISVAVGLAQDQERLAGLRRSTRERLAGSRLMDANGFARDVEAVYRRMWREWCARSAPDR